MDSPLLLLLWTFFPGVVVRVGIVSLGGLGGPRPRGPCGPLFVIFVAGVVGSPRPLLSPLVESYIVFIAWALATKRSVSSWVRKFRFCLKNTAKNSAFWPR